MRCRSLCWPMPTAHSGGCPSKGPAPQNNEWLHLGRCEMENIEQNTGNMLLILPSETKFGASNELPLPPGQGSGQVRLCHSCLFSWAFTGISRDLIEKPRYDQTILLVGAMGGDPCALLPSNVATPALSSDWTTCLGPLSGQVYGTASVTSPHKYMSTCTYEEVYALGSPWPLRTEPMGPYFSILFPCRQVRAQAVFRRSQGSWWLHLSSHPTPGLCTSGSFCYVQAWPGALPSKGKQDETLHLFSFSMLELSVSSLMSAPVRAYSSFFSIWKVSKVWEMARALWSMG